MASSSSTYISPAKLRERAQQALREGDDRKAEMILMQVLSEHAADVEAIRLLGDVSWARKDPRLAMGYYTLAVKADPTDLLSKRRFVLSAWNVPFETFNADAEATLFQCLTTPELSGADLRAPWYSLLLTNPGFADIFRGAQQGPEYFAALKDWGPLLRPYFLTGLKKIIVNDLSFEKFLGTLRRFFLDHPPEPDSVAVPLAAALALYCFNTDYIFDVTQDEQRKVDALKVKIEAGDMAGALVYAGYAPLSALANAAAAGEYLRKSPAGAEVAQALVDDYNDLQKTAAGIVAITEIEDGTSAKVREQYEMFPYPRWRGLPRAIMPRLEKDAAVLDRKGAQALIAGCGTGQHPLYYGALYPRAQFLAVDLSRASLSYGMNKAREYGIRNVEFRQGDILKLGILPQKFDFIGCGGVLHHMREPLAGWKVLADLLKPGGVMQISLYSKPARKHITEIRDIIAQKGYPATTEGIRTFRREAPEVLGGAKMHFLSGAPDYFQTATCCDLLFHVSEYQFDIPEIGRALDTLGLVFDGFMLNTRIQAIAAEDVPQGRAEKDLAAWHDFEMKHTMAFAEMYSFWCRKRG